MHLQVVVLLLVGSWMLPNSRAWTTVPMVSSSSFARRRAPTNNHNNALAKQQWSSSVIILQDASEGEQDKNDALDFMRQVRSLQRNYYQTNEFPRSSLDASTGILHNLPLWRVGWTELPGRSNMLHVHEPMYTHMFQSLLSHDKPWYFGHLYLPSASDNVKRSTSPLPAKENGSDHKTNENSAFKLKTWKDELKEGEDKTDPQSAVIGTLLRVADYRRMENGRLFLLVEALERFVVTNVQQELPYSMADVQLLPDTEEVDPDEWVSACTEGEIRDARSLALAESFQRYHPYEYDETFRLPIPNKSNLQTSDIGGSLLTLVVPYVPLSKTADLAKLKDTPLDLTTADDGHNTNCSDDNDIEGGEDKSQLLVTDEQPCLEQQLLQGNILKDYQHPDEAVGNLSSDDLEYRIWIEINDFLKSTKTPVSPVLLGLMPQGIEWPSNFYLRKIADDIVLSDLKHNFVQVSPLLPSHRRLRKLSYSVTTLLESKPGMEGLRQQLLETASTRARLVMILEKLEAYNSIAVWGEFE